MGSCSTGNCGKSKVLGVLRIVLGIGMLVMGIMKLFQLPGVLDFLGQAAHGLGFDFLSTTVWGWIAIVGEILAGLLLLAGCKGSRVGSFLTAIIMIFAMSSSGFAENFFADPLALSFFVVAMIILIFGGGAFNLCGRGCCCKSGGPCSCKGNCDCKGGSCCTKFSDENNVIEA